MAFPTNPVNGQQANINGITYTYSTALTSWNVSTSVSNSFVSLSASGNITSSNASIIGTTASTTKTTGALTVAGGIGIAGTAYTNRSVVQGAYGNIILNEFTGIYNQKDTGTSLIQTTTNALSAGVGVQVAGGVGNASQLYSTGNVDIKVGVVVRAEDVPTGGTVIATVASTGVTVNGAVSASGNITGNYILGNGSQLSGISVSTSKIFNGTSEANIGVSGGNANITIGGTSNVAVFATSGQYVTGIISATGNITGGNLTTAGTMTAATVTETSSVALKENFRPIENPLEKILQLLGQIYDRKDGSSRDEAGLVAEDVYKIIPNLVKIDAHGNPESVFYSRLSVYLLEALKVLHNEIKQLKAGK